MRYRSVSVSKVYPRRYDGQPSTVAEHMPSAHRAHAEWTPSRLIRWAEKVGPATGELVTRILESRPHPEQGYKAVLGLMRLGRQHGNPRLDAASARAMALGSCRFHTVKNILAAGQDHLPRRREPSPTRPARCPSRRACPPCPGRHQPPGALSSPRGRAGRPARPGGPRAGGMSRGTAVHSTRWPIRTWVGSCPTATCRSTWGQFRSRPRLQDSGTGRPPHRDAPMPGLTSPVGMRQRDRPRLRWDTACVASPDRRPSRVVGVPPLRCGCRRCVRETLSASVTRFVSMISVIEPTTVPLFLRRCGSLGCTQCVRTRCSRT